MKKTFTALFFALLLPSFAFAADMECLVLPQADSQQTEAGGFNKKEFREEGITQTENPAMDLMGCAASVTQGGSPGSAVKGNCGCKKAIKKLCSFNVKKQRVKASGGADVAWCVPFAPWML